MRLHRFIVDLDLARKNLVIDEPDLVGQLKNVLRLGVGDRFILGDGKSNEAQVIVRDVKKGMFMVDVEANFKNENEPRSQAVLYCALLKRENFELVVQKATEIGVKEIIPLITERTVKLNLREDRLNKIIKEAAEQSGRGVLPVLREPMKFDDAVESAKENHVNLFFNASGDRLHPSEHMAGVRVGAWVGPEGGWTEEELTKAEGEKFTISSLGSTILRAETAAIVASHIISNI